MTTQITPYTVGRLVPATSAGINQLPALFNDSWIKEVLNELDFGRAFDVPNAVYPYNVKSTVDKDDTPTSYTIEVALAGVGKDKIDIKVRDGHLIIDVDKEEEVEDGTTTYVKKGISRRKGQLSFALSDKTDAKNITSTYTDGLLRVIVPVVQPEVINIDVKVG
jgi:HSP20 family molecular chaperone IbpA